MLSITVLYEGGGRQQVARPGTSPGRFQRGKEIPEATTHQERGQADRGGNERKDNVQYIVQGVRQEVEDKGNYKRMVNMP